MKVYKNINEYIKDIPKSFVPKIKEMQGLIKKLVPQGKDAIRYGIPTVQIDGKNFIHFAAMKKHFGFYPSPSGVKAFEAELKKQKIDFSKGCIRFLYSIPLPISLITKIIKFRLKEEKAIKAQKVKPSKVVEGLTIKYHANGKTIWSKGVIKNGKPEGYWEWYRIDGTLKRSGVFKDGEPVGKWITYTTKGVVYKVTEKK